MGCQVCGGQHSTGQACQPAASPDPLLGTVLGSFRLVRRLGKGGMGTVYLGEQTLIGSRVAVKVLHGELAQDAHAVARFHAEARAVNLIGHENIVSIFDMGVAPPNTHYFVMEHLQGQPLTSLLGGPVEPKVAIPILLQVCDALAAAHARGVVHRDLKPDNIFLVQRGREERFAKVLDFGVAKLLTADVAHTAYGMCIGTPTYMAPEQWLGQGIDGRADLYALGILTYRMAAGQLPFPRGGMLEMMNCHRERIPPSPRAVNPQVSEAWSSVIMRTIAKRPEERFQTAEELAEALRDVLRRPGQPASPTGARTPVTGPQRVDEESSTSIEHEQQEPPGPLPLRARVRSLTGQELFHAVCTDLSRGGVFICHAGGLPALFTRFHVRLELPDRTLECLCEVVRHVSAREAAAWKMSPGFGVQFVEVSPAFRASISQLLQVYHPPTPDEVLEHYRRCERGDHYRLLQLSPNADFAEVHERAEKARGELTALLAAPLQQDQRRTVHEILERITRAVDTLGSETTRVEYDARRQNFLGVARCIDAGLPERELDSARKRYLSARPEAPQAAQYHFHRGVALERAGQLTEAVQEYEQGLAMDPLNLQLQQHYWALHRRTLRAPTRRPAARSA